jgi:hypothetical protein
VLVSLLGLVSLGGLALGLVAALLCTPNSPHTDRRTRESATILSADGCHAYL